MFAELLLGFVDLGLRSVLCLIGDGFYFFTRAHFISDGLTSCSLRIRGGAVTSFVKSVLHIICGALDGVGYFIQSVFTHALPLWFANVPTGLNLETLGSHEPTRICVT
jgi:hypothetical protein